MTIRPATTAEVEAVAAIYKHQVLTGTGTFEIEPPSADEMAQRYLNILHSNLPYLIAEVDGQVAASACTCSSG